MAAAALVAAGGMASLDAQRQWPLAPVPPDGQRVAPFFDGWYENPDGTITLSFGYSNLNRDELVEIPLGPDNFIEPKEYDGRQPTSFPASASRPDGGGDAARRDRERGVFTVTVPAGFKGDVVWTLRNRGQAYRVPGRSKTGAYGLRWPMAMGSIPPLLGMKAGGPTGRGPAGIQLDPMQTTVGTPLELSIWTKDDSVREKETVQIKERVPSKGVINVNWYKHSGPGPVTFQPRTIPIAELEGTAKTTVTFTQPGVYVLRVRADNFGRVDTSAGNQCCWTNGYFRITAK